MSKLHVTQIAGYLNAQLKNSISMADTEKHDAFHTEKVFLTRALACLAVSHLTEVPLQDLCTYVTDGSKDGGIDLIYFDSNERTLYLVQTKWHHDGHGSIELGDALKFLEGVKKVLDNDVEELNEKIKSRKLDIEQAIFDANAKFVLVIAHTGQEDLNEEVSRPVNSYVESQNDTSEIMSVRVLKQGDLHKAVAAGVAGAPISVEVQVNGWGQIRSPHFAIYGQVCAADIATWIEENGPRLFESNLRQFLGNSVVNQDIVRTLVERPEEFWYYNNGITAVATEVKKKPLGGSSTESGIFECSGFSVVNGAQTVGAIHAASRTNAESVARAMVPVRVISSANSETGFSLQVTKCTNTQNAIEKRDFVALDSEQERIRQELYIEGVEYAYKAGAGVGTTRQRFDLTEATVALACSNADVGLAVQAKREIGKLWEDLNKAPYKQLFNSGITGPFVWEAVKALREVDKCLQIETKKYDGRDALICVHGNRFIQWTALRRLEIKPGFKVENLQEDIPSLVEKTIKEVIGVVKEQYADAYPASLFKNLKKCRLLAEALV